MGPEDAKKKLRNLREKIVDRNVFGADEAIELVDLLLELVEVGSGGPPKTEIPPPPNSDQGSGGGSVGGTTVQ